MLIQNKRCVRLEALQTVKPREFCRLWFNSLEEDEQVRGYRAKCVLLLSRILGVKPETISSKWGEGIEFDQMPEQYEKTLAYANSLREIIDAAGKNPDLADLIIERMKSR
ncbi:MAG: hypothetical protein ACM37W_24270 [Actinomycetota bacterium]